MELAGSDISTARPVGLREQLAPDARWTCKRSPFPHILARRVFTEHAYARLEEAFRDHLAAGLSETPDAARFARSTRGYDAYGLSFHEGMRSALRVFWSVEWHDLLARLAGVTPTFNVNGGLHHHTVGSGNGRVHNDLNPGWFPDEPLPANDIRLSSPRHCDYYSGASASSPTAENVRALAMIFFLANGPWRPGDGGETGLYESPRQAIDRPSAVVPPLDNTMLVFECTPFSYHAFLSNRRRERNSVILWLHRRRAEVLSRWGEAAIVRWPQRQR